METRIRKWGNSLALRIPQSLARQIALKPGARSVRDSTVRT